MFDAVKQDLRITYPFADYTTPGARVSDRYAPKAPRESGEPALSGGPAAAAASAEGPSAAALPELPSAAAAAGQPGFSGGPGSPIFEPARSLKNILFELGMGMARAYLLPNLRMLMPWTGGGSSAFSMITSPP